MTKREFEEVLEDITKGIFHGFGIGIFIIVILLLLLV